MTKFFVLLNLGYDGTIQEEFDTQQEALDYIRKTISEYHLLEDFQLIEGTRLNINL